MSFQFQLILWIVGFSAPTFADSVRDYLPDVRESEDLAVQLVNAGLLAHHEANQRQSTIQHDLENIQNSITNNRFLSARETKLLARGSVRFILVHANGTREWLHEDFRSVSEVIAFENRRYKLPEIFPGSRIEDVTVSSKWLPRMGAISTAALVATFAAPPVVYGAHALINRFNDSPTSLDRQEDDVPAAQVMVGQ